MNQATTETTVPITWPGTSTTSNTSAPTVPTTTKTTFWTSPRLPSPRIMPASSCQGFIVASSSSTTRLDFSSTTPCATNCPTMISRKYRRLMPTIATTVAWVRSSEDACRATTATRGGGCRCTSAAASWSVTESAASELSTSACSLLPVCWTTSRGAGPSGTTTAETTSPKATAV